MSGEAFNLCICGFPRWRHPANEEDRKIIAYCTTSANQPHHLFIAPATSPETVTFRRLPNGRFARLTPDPQP